jgi:hypothetical protein
VSAIVPPLVNNRQSIENGRIANLPTHHSMVGYDNRDGTCYLKAQY